MSSTTSYRLSGIALILGSVLSISYYVSEAFIGGPFPEALASPVAVIGSLVGFLGSLLVLLGLPGMLSFDSKFAKTGRYASEEENGEDMCQIQAPISFREFKKIVWERAIRNSAS